ncbi:polyketide synthase [Patulibacter defluvii]|uniref:polyketide synthase n=1 Tax=Patulibacter defluvii TaxID=3095358 RepID=UPI002A754043|nr:polyketide synthase [Patulibacter sp. DM4]
MSSPIDGPRPPASAPAASRSAGALAPEPLLARIADGDVAVALTFAGQGSDVLEELAALVAANPLLLDRLAAAERLLGALAASPAGEASGRFRHGLALQDWVLDPEAAPPREYRVQAAVSYPLILLTQALLWEQLAADGLAAALAAPAARPVAVAGHSQGLLAALLVAEAGGRAGEDRFRIDDALLERHLRYAFAQGLAMAATAEPGGDDPELAPLVALDGPRPQRIGPLLDAANARLGADDQVHVALVNGPTTTVVGGTRAGLAELRRTIAEQTEAEQEARRRGARGGAPLHVAWNPLPVDVAFHTPRLSAARERFAGWLASDGAGLLAPAERLALPVLSPRDGHDLRAADDLTAAVLAAQFDAPLRWDRTVAALAERGADWLLDLGPGTAVARLAGASLRGSGVHVVGLASPDGRRVLATPASAPAGPGVRYDELAPGVVELADGRRHLDTRYTRLTGRPPVILAGMTPTTSDAPIVAAAANAGYAAELAGGGQPDRRTFERRIAELGELLEPGREVGFNTLLLDRHLWSLHVEREGLLLEARDGGAPLAGLTVSAGIPEVDEAIALLDRLAAHGMRLNAFKPGTVEQVRRTLAIADAAPHHVLCVQIEGGQGGGHHSWEDLEELLLETYHELRRRENVLVVAGGGIGTPERARELLLGEWSRRHGQRPMPVDAVLVGTAAMAVREAAASPQVKQALVDAPGADRWIPRTAVAGGVTSATSNLNADIHLLENSAARAGKLLQEVAGDERAVWERRDEIVAALARTAKPYFGDLERMPYLAVLERLVELLATGRHGRYDDGAWGHPSWRARALAVFRRAAARLDPAEAGAIVPPVAVAADLDDPAAALAHFGDRYPAAATTLLHPADAQHVLEVCDRPGKPVPFVPVLDAEVRRWYMADGLWQAQDDRWDADAVFVIPGPWSVGGIERADEPVAELLARFEAAAIAAVEDPATVVRRDRLGDPGPLGGPAAALAHGCRGPVAALLSAPSVTLPGADGGRARSAVNPLARLLRTGDELHAERDGDELLRVVARPRRGADGEQLVVERDGDDGARLGVLLPAVDGEPQALTVRYRTLPAPGAVAEVDGVAARAAFAARALDPAARGARWAFDPAQAAGYAAATGARHGDVPVDLALSLAWPAVAARLAEDPAIAARLAELVHGRHEVALGEAWPPRPGQAGPVDARVVEVEDPTDGPTRIRVAARILDDAGGPPLATVRAELVLLGHDAVSGERLRRDGRHDRELRLAGAPEAELLAAAPWLRWHDGAVPAAGERLRLWATTALRVARDGAVHVHAAGEVERDGEPVATIALDEARAADPAAPPIHPVERLLELLAPAGPPLYARPRRTLARAEDVAPESLRAFARIGGDHNPLHRCVLGARLAGLDAPIVHGAWTAARASAFVVDALADGDATALERWRVRFLAPVAPGALLELEAVRTGVRDGRRLVEVRVVVDGQDVALGEAVLRPAARRPRALLLPGQGIQRRGLGEEGRSRSAAARAVWRQADAIARERLGLPLLDVVARDPAAVRLADGRTLRHPDGVLQRTEVTQVALVALAAAQLAELRAEGVLPADGLGPGVVAAGHSVGEFSALHALGVLDLEAALTLVHARGRAMQACVPRDADGASRYRMAVVSPRAAGTDEAGLLAAVAALRAEGTWLEVVNHNARDRQYAVVGEAAALDALAARLGPAVGGRGSTPLRRLPGIDVPFHSSVLAPAVDRFRPAVEAAIGMVDHRRLVGRWIPNLVGRPFALDGEFAAAVERQIGIAPATGGDADARARALLVLLLSHQLAAPVRWIATQEALLAPAAVGGLGVGELVEVAPGHATVLSGLARPGLPEGVALRHVEHDRERLLERDEAEAAPTPPVDDEPAQPAPIAAPAPTPPPTAATAAPATDRPVDAGDALRLVLALQARIRLDQVPDDETIDELFQGVSSRRNQVLIDLGREFSLSGAEGAQQQTIGELVATLRERGERYRFPGDYLREALASGVARALGRSGLAREQAVEHLRGAWDLAPGLADQVLARLALDTRDGPSARGDALARLRDGAPTSPAAARELLDRAAALTAADLGLRLEQRRAEDPAAGPAVVAEHVERALIDASRTLAAALGRPFPDEDAPPAAPDPGGERLAALDAELGRDRAAAVAPRFDARRHVRLAGAWAAARWDLVRLFHDALDERIDGERQRAIGDRIAQHAGDPAVAATARWLAARARAHGRDQLATLLDGLAEPRRTALPVAGVRPAAVVAHGAVPRAEERPDDVRPDDLLAALRAGAGPLRVADPALAAALAERLEESRRVPTDLRGEVALVTGASPGSIAAALVRRLLRAGATVVVTSSGLDRERRAFYRELHREAAAPGAELHLLPANLASFADVDALVAWLAAPVVVQRQRPDLALPPLVPTIVAPFAAAVEEGGLEQAGAGSEAAFRLQLLGVERLIAAVAAHASEQRPATVLLPLSPNHGDFGGDGAYAETKAGLEVLLRRWRSERGWGARTAIVAPRIGWVRGTGLMAAADAVAPLVEERLGVRTFTPDELGWLLEGLVAGPVAAAARRAPVVVEASGGLDAVADLRAGLDPLIDELRQRALDGDRRRQLERALAPPAAAGPATVDALPSPGTDRAPAAAGGDGPRPAVDPRELVVIVGSGELGPAGSGRTRFALERDGALPPAAIAELAWLCGLVRHELDRYRGRWVDAASGDEVPEAELAARYGDAVRERIGVRPLEDDGTIDPAGHAVLAPVASGEPVAFTVDDEATARSFLAADPEGARIARTADGGWRVTLRAGARIRVERREPHRRRVAGQLPRGLDLARLGVPADLLASADRMALVNLACTSEAFAAAGLEPEELLAHVHPTLVANTQGCGLGGMASLRRLLLDHLLDEERQPDRIQESLGNVVAAHVVQSYVGSYGPMVHPVAACATAAVSLEEAHDKIRAGKALAVLAGGFDDLTPEGLIGFGDMGATADSDELEAMGIEPDEASRPGDLRRRGFVEAQGGGSLLVVRGDVALELGLPVRAVLAYAGSFADGVQQSIPAPGLGVLGAATGGPDSPLATALARLGLGADDVGVVSKHDTSTEINDPHEADLHDRIQTALGRTPGNPLLVVSQKAVTGHSKGGAAAWQVDGVLRMMETGVVPGNRHLESPDRLLRESAHLAVGDRPLARAAAEPLRAALVTSLGFGHVGALLALAHPDVFLAAIPDDQREDYRARAAARRADGAQRLLAARFGRPLVVRRDDRRIAADGDDAGGAREAEARAILDPATRLRDGALRPPADDGPERAR